MIIARVEGENGNQMFIMGVTRGNIDALTAGKPIFRKLPDTDIEVMIFFEETLGDCFRTFKESGLKMPDVPNVGRS